MNLTGIAAAPGPAVGPAFVHQPQEAAPSKEHIPESEVSKELSRFESAIEHLVERLAQDHERLRAEGRGEAAGDLKIVPKLVEAGVAELSMTPLAMPRIKKPLGEL